MIAKPPFLPLLVGVLLVPWINWVILTPVVFPPPDDRYQIIGEWRGVSECVKASWNTSCRDELVIYDCEQSSRDSTLVVMHAGRTVGNKTVQMEDLVLRFQEVANIWVGGYLNTPVPLLWQFTVHGDYMTGRLVELPSSRVFRHVKALRRRV